MPDQKVLAANIASRPAAQHDTAGAVVTNSVPDIAALVRYFVAYGVTRCSGGDDTQCNALAFDRRVSRTRTAALPEGTSRGRLSGRPRTPGWVFASARARSELRAAAFTAAREGGIGPDIIAGIQGYAIPSTGGTLVRIPPRHWGAPRQCNQQKEDSGNSRRSASDL